jgi:Lsr2
VTVSTPSVGRPRPIVFCETRQLAEEWTYRFLAAARTWAETEEAAIGRIMPAGGPAASEPALDQAPAAPEPSTAEVRAWARAQGLPVPDRGRLRPEIWDAWRSAASAENSRAARL